MGKWRQLFHPGPIIALSIITFCSVMAIILIFEYHQFSLFDENISFGDETRVFKLLTALSVFMIWPVLTMTNYFKAAFGGPGFVPLRWRPLNKEMEKYLQYCDNCDGFKPPRAHHCRKCGRCALKMDHHCPWINTCAGAANQASFIFFLLFAPIGCIHAVTYFIPMIYHFVFFNWYYQNDYAFFLRLYRLPAWFLILTFLATGLAIGVTFAVGMLLFFQLKIAVRNQTGIESYISKKAKFIRERQEKDIDLGLITPEERYPEYRFPYNVSIRKNLHEVFCKGFPDDGEYMAWNVLPGSSPLDLTTEQIRQKQSKKDHASPHEIIEAYDGRWCPVFKYGWRVAFFPPIIDEIRLKVAPGARLNVTRYRGQWLYGEVVDTNIGESGKPQRGWVPKGCAKQLSQVESKLTDNKAELRQKAD